MIFASPVFTTKKTVFPLSDKNLPTLCKNVNAFTSLNHHEVEKNKMTLRCPSIAVDIFMCCQNSLKYMTLLWPWSWHHDLEKINSLSSITKVWWNSHYWVVRYCANRLQPGRMHAQKHSPDGHRKSQCLWHTYRLRRHKNKCKHTTAQNVQYLSSHSIKILTTYIVLLHMYIISNCKLIYPDAIDCAHMSNPAMCKLRFFAGTTFTITRVRVTIAVSSTTEPLITITNQQFTLNTATHCFHCL